MFDDSNILNEANKLKEEFRKTNKIALLDDVISYLETAVNHPDFPNLAPVDRARIIFKCGIEYCERYTYVGSRSDLESGYKFIDQAIQTLEEVGDNQIELIDTFAVGIRMTSPLNENEEILKKSISIHEISLKKATRNDPLKAQILSNSGNAYRQLNQVTGNPEDLDFSISFHNSAINLAGKKSPKLPGYKHNLGNALRQRFRTNGDIKDLNKAIELQYQAVIEESEEEWIKAKFEDSLAISLNSRYQELANEEDLENAIRYVKSSVDRKPVDTRNYLGQWALFGHLLRERYNLRNRVEDLESAKNFLEFVEKSASNFPDLLRDVLDDLAIVYKEEFDLKGDIDAQDKSIDCRQKLTELIPKTSSQYTDNLVDLAIHLARKYSFTQDSSLLFTARRNFLEAITLRTEDREFVARCHHNLANLLGIILKSTNDENYFQEEMNHREQSILKTPEGSSELPERLAGLAQDYARLFDLNHDRASLDKAISLLNEAISLPEPSEIAYAGILHSLASSLALRYENYGDEGDLDLCREYIHKAIDISRDRSSNATATFAKNWAFWSASRGDWHESTTAFREAINAVDELFDTQVFRQHKEDWLRQHVFVYNYAAYAFAKDQKYVEAVLAIERGRAKLLNEALLIEHEDLNKLAQEIPDRAEKLQALGSRLSQLQAYEIQTSQEITQTQFQEEMRQAKEDLNQEIRDIRRLEGFSEFLDPITIDEITSAAQIKPLIYIAATQFGGLALVIDGTGKIVPVWFEKLDILSLHKYLDKVQLQLLNDGDFINSIDSITSYLWDVLMGHLCDRLSDLGIDKCVLICQGILGILPLHAAWTLDKTKSSDRRYVLDELVVSVAPSAKALRVCARKKDIPMDSVLSIEDPTSTLVFAPFEVGAVLGYFRNQNLIGGLAADKMIVIDRMSDANVIHFCCHGYSNPQDPLQSGLIMALDEPLLLSDILQTTFDNTRLAVLSACETGLIGREFMDEVIGFPSGFLQAGIPAVVSSIWPVDDESTSVLIDSFFDNLIHLGLEPDDALRKAQVEIRDGQLGKNDFSKPYFWASFFLTGL